MVERYKNDFALASARNEQMSSELTGLQTSYQAKCDDALGLSARLEMLVAENMEKEAQVASLKEAVSALDNKVVKVKEDAAQKSSELDSRVQDDNKCGQ